MKVLVVGAGGREHALVRALARSGQAPELLCAPGNAGIAADARLLGVAADDVPGITSAAQREGVDLVVVGPEAPLVGGLVDELASAGIAAFGPTAAAAQLEGSKAYAKRAMDEAGVPTARWRQVGSLHEGMEAVAELGSPGVVVKADGLAAGKGVTVAADAEQAQAALREIFVEKRFAGSSGTPAGGASAAGAGGSEASAVVEELLVGRELSLLALCDGERALAMAPARDFKRIFDGDRGPNTGGMGSYSPVPGIDDARVREIAAAVHQPIVELMRARGTPFHGVLYAGLMLTHDGPRVLEFNVRFGDPETQAVLPRLRSDLLELLLAATHRNGLAGAELRWGPEWAVTVVLASAGYPASAHSGDAISGLPETGGARASGQAAPARTTPARMAPARTTPARTTPARTAPARTAPARTAPARTTPARTTPARTTPARTAPARTPTVPRTELDLAAAGIEITHAGTAVGPDGAVVTAGGRVLNVTGFGADMRSARSAAYAGAQMIYFDGMQLRHDIAGDTPQPVARAAAETVDG